MKRWLGRIGIALGALLVGAAVLVALDVRSQLPDRDTPRIPGLGAPVEVRFDARGIPTVRARTLADALRVEGYLQARDRLFQMELARRVAGGELSELVGPVALPLDRRQRTLGFAHVAEDAVIRDEDLVEKDFVELGLSQHVCKRTDLDARTVHRE